MSWGFGAACTGAVCRCTTVVRVSLGETQRGCSAGDSAFVGFYEHLTCYDGVCLTAPCAPSPPPEKCRELQAVQTDRVSSSALEIVRHTACSADERHA